MSGNPSQLELMSSVAPMIGEPDRARFSEIVALYSNPSHLSIGSAAAKAHSRQFSRARQDLLAILRRAEASAPRDARIAALIRHYEGRDEPE